MRCPRTLTKEGIEMQLGVNHMGHFLLTNLLLDTIKSSAPSRIINVSSTAHLRGKIHLDDLNGEQSYDPSEAYAQSKLANILFTRELSKKLQGDFFFFCWIFEFLNCFKNGIFGVSGTGVTVNAVHPGIVATEITRHMSFHNSTFSAIFLKPIVYPFIKTPKQGAKCVLFAALDPSLDKVSGKYFALVFLTFLEQRIPSN